MPAKSKAMTRQDRILNKMRKAQALLLDAWVLLKEENQKGRQFDFTNSPRLSDLNDQILNRSQQIDKIIYQQ